MPYHVYILTCKDGTLYTGYTKNLKARMKLHRMGKGARYLKAHPPEQVVYTEKFKTRGEAMKRERRIKRLTHAQKLKLTSSWEK